MSDDKPWYPNLEKNKQFRDHANPAVGEDPPLRVPDPTRDTAPLQGSKDLSDEDSLEDVIAGSFEPDAKAPSPIISKPKTPPGKP